MAWFYFLAFWIVGVVFFIGYEYGHHHGYQHGYRRGLYQSVSENLHRPWESER